MQSAQEPPKAWCSEKNRNGKKVVRPNASIYCAPSENCWQCKAHKKHPTSQMIGKFQCPNCSTFFNRDIGAALSILKIGMYQAVERTLDLPVAYRTKNDDDDDDDSDDNDNQG